MKSTSYFFGLFTMSIAVSLVGCSSDDNGDGGDNGGGTSGESKYIIAATPQVSEAVADYLLTADDLGQGTITTRGNGVEQDGTWRYYVTHNNMFFSMLYGQGNPGAVTAYELNAEGELEKLTNFQSETVQAFAVVNDDILMIKISRNATEPYAYWYRLDISDKESIGIVDEGVIDTQKLADTENGELAFFSWITQVGNKVYLPYFTMKGCCNDAWGTEYPDEANIAVYSYPEMELEKVIRDDRTSAIGSYFTNGLTVDEKGDAYAFSSATATTGGELSSTKPSAVTRIKNGTTEFDQEYYFDLEEATGGLYITDHVYAGNGKFLGIFGVDKASSSGVKYGVIDAYNKTVTPVSGLPEPDDIEVFTNMNNYVSDGGATVSTGITDKAGASYIYNIDIASATATRGLQVEQGTITTISRLDPAE
ncbi:DUF4374 domain-containing protein [Sinomicrobium soli]|uniref:DUF4374 domain-containing protein n=1 Tax=Sinomicrobium sp. N-1-3-6 TaxID=2219864 RepID=UPI000DCCDC71|nr:DUF4374 domain-containing protein [Sinomicrobium sp. N-1-3-6]RAV27944.1 hypothetical protein DN748_16225 [Sinomicrobium sp. N-1-3-6]